MMRVTPTTSIAIIGAGVAGLSLARTLARLGFERIVVFEAAASVGGKSCTVDIDGRPHDLGATMGVPHDYRAVLDIASEGGIPTESLPREQHYCLDRGRPVPLNTWREMPRVLAQACRYVSLHRRTFRGDLHEADHGLYAPWAEVAREHGLEDVSKRTLCYRTGYGYGYDDEVPAVMYASMLRPSTLAGLAVAEPFVWTGGTQPIWLALAERLAISVEIRTASPVTRIVRHGSTVSVTSRGHVERFDRVVLACDPSVLVDVLDTTGIERTWFSQVRAYPYATFACDVEGLSSGRRSIGYLDDNMRRDRPGHPMAWVKRYADASTFVFHLFAPTDMSDAEVVQRIRGDVAKLGGRLVACRASRRWRFFPHFTSEAMRAGCLTAIDRWQGDRGVYLIGEVLSFSSMARVADHAIRFAHRIAHEATPSTTSLPNTTELAS